MRPRRKVFDKEGRHHPPDSYDAAGNHEEGAEIIAENENGTTDERCDQFR